MRVLHLINTLSAGGAEHHLLALARGLGERGVETAVACLKERIRDTRTLRPDFDEAGIRVVDLGLAGRFDVRFFPRLGRLLAEGWDVLHTHLPRADLGGRVAGALGDALPWVSSVHDRYSASWSGAWSLPLFDRIWRRADAVVAISGAIREWLVEGRGVPRERVRVIPYGLDADAFRGDGASLRQAWELVGRPVVGTVGRLEPRKGHDRLIRAMPRILERVPAAVLLIAGPDPFHHGERLLEMIRERGLEEAVRLVGFRSDVASFLDCLDVFAFTTRSEGFGLVTLEAMAVGKPVVASRIPPLTGIVEDGETGLLVDGNDPGELAGAVAGLLEDPERARAMGRRGGERVRSHFGVDAMVDATLDLYRELVEGGQGER